MISLPDFANPYPAENDFYLSCDVSRFSKFIAHYELFRMTTGIPGAFIECGVFKGASLARFASFRSLFMTDFARKIIAFDSFGAFPETSFDPDKKLRQKYIEAAGSESISTDQMMQVLHHKGVGQNVELVAGDITETLPAYVEQHPELVISLLNLDTDIYEPSVVVLEQLWPRIVPGGILILDDYGVWAGETKAVDEFFRDQQVMIRKFEYAMTPCYIIKDDLS